MPVPSPSAPPLVAFPDEAARLMDALNAYSHREEVSSSINAALGEGEGLIRRAGGCSPFLARLMAQRPEWLAAFFAEGPQSMIEKLCASLEAATDAELMRQLRERKAQVALTTALADVSGAWNIPQVTAALTRFADFAVDAALAFLLRALNKEGVLPDIPPERSGVFAVALGKQGAMELNYSSDIDIILLYDPARMGVPPADVPREKLIRMTQKLVTLLNERTGEGYVFRVDLRLRPDPLSTPAIMSTEAALTYYESVGQNWERAAFIKARAVGGDLEAGRRFLKNLTPFIWRKYLDFAMIQDIASIKRQIDSRHEGLPEGLRGYNVKLGAGGIRDIELFTQTQQLIWGGKQPDLREPQTCRALEMLAARNIVAPQDAARLTEAYDLLRRAEHALQMVDDQQTHSIPDDDGGIARMAGLMGYASAESCLADLKQTAETIAAICRPLFQDQKRLAGEGHLAFTGTEDDPATLDTLTRMGYRDASTVSRLIRHWHTGACRATASARARELLTELVPDILHACATSSAPDATFQRFDQFLRAQPAGVQLFSLLTARPALLGLLAVIFSSSPHLAEMLTKYPHVLDRLLAAGLNDPFPSTGQLQQELDSILAHARDLEDRLHLCRQFRNDYAFLIAARLLHGSADPAGAGRQFSHLADVLMARVLNDVKQEFAAQYGTPDEGRCALVALGKWGSGTLTFESDLDLMLVYDAKGQGSSRLPVDTYYTRLTQRLVTAVSGMMKYGRLYELDLRLRPFGKDGPAATSLASIAPYYRGQAWSYEWMALLRARDVAGDAALREKLRAVMDGLLASPPDKKTLFSDYRGLERKIRASLPPENAWDVKRLPGGILDIEMTVQCLALAHMANHPELRRAGELEALDILAARGLIPRNDALILRDTLTLLLDVQQILRLCQRDAARDALITDRHLQLLRQLLHGDTIEAMKEILGKQTQTSYTAISHLMHQETAP